MKFNNKLLFEMIDEEIEKVENSSNKKTKKPDHEGKMAKAELRDMIKNGLIIYNTFDKNDELPGWISAYITLASDYMHSVMEYMVENNSQEMSDEDSEQTEEPEVIDT